MDQGKLPENSTQPLPSLQKRIDEISCHNLTETIRAVVDLAPDLITSISSKGERIIAHPAYKGTANLDELAKLYLSCGWRCEGENAAFDVRLLHLTLDPIFESLYLRSDEALEHAIAGGIVTTFPESGEGCAHCRGEPAAVIPGGFAAGEALWFEEEQYRRLWGSEESTGTRIAWDGNGNQKQTSLMASKAQVEEAMSRNAEVAASGLAML
jgi:hypothetical protein